MLLETERRERRYKIYQLMDDLSTIPEAVIRAENIILKATLEMEV